MKTYIPIILDTIFVAFICFLLLYIPLYVTNGNKALLVSLLLCCSLTLPSFFIIRKKKLKNLKKAKDVAQKKDILYSLNFKTETELNNIFESAFKNKKMRYIVKESNIFLTDKNCTVKYMFRFNEINDDKVFNLVKNDYGKRSILILSNSEKTPNIVKNLKNVHFFNASDTYNLIKQSDYAVTEKQKPTKSRLKDYAKKFFKKKNALKYFLLGIWSYVFGFFVSIGIFYTIFGGTLLVFSIICLLFPDGENPSDFFSG